jgi:hypothetical protein
MRNLYCECDLALRIYVREAQRTSEMIQGMTQLPISRSEWGPLSRQLNAETMAQERYHDARRRLFEAVQQESVEEKLQAVR